VERVRILGISSLIFLLLISFFIQWEKEGQDKKDGNLTIYKVDRFIGQRWKISYMQGNAKESPVFSEEQIQESIKNVDESLKKIKEIKQIEEKKKEQKRIIEFNKEEHDNYIDPNYYGNYVPESEIPASDSLPQNLQAFSSKMYNETLHKKAIESLASEQVAYLAASSSLSKLEDKQKKLNDEIRDNAIKQLTSRAWIIRNSINGLRIGFIALCVVLIFFKWRKTLKPIRKEV
jgi:hypothetical protein